MWLPVLDEYIYQLQVKAGLRLPLSVPLTMQAMLARLGDGLLRLCHLDKLGTEKGCQRRRCNLAHDAAVTVQRLFDRGTELLHLGCTGEEKEGRALPLCSSSAR